MSLTLRSDPDRAPALQEKFPDYQVMHGGLRVGRIYRQESASRPDTQWLWAINGVHGPPEVMRIHGTTATLDAAKAELRINWGKWLAWAKLQEIGGPKDASAGEHA